MANMNPNKRSKMTRQERAKQFMPFAALKGYEEALKREEEKHSSEYGINKKEPDDNLE